MRGTIGPVSLDEALAYYTVVAAIGLAVLYAVLRVIRSPFGHVLVAIRENQLRASFQGYPIERYKLAAFVISAVVTGLAGALLGFQTYLVSAEAVSVVFSGELLAMVVIGGMHHILGPTLGVLFYILFRELFSIWTSNWLLCVGHARLHALVRSAISRCSAARRQHLSCCCTARIRGSEIFRSSQSDRPRFYLSRVIGQEVAPWRFVQKGRQVAVASSGLFPQPLWINACGKRRLWKI